MPVGFCLFILEISCKQSNKWRLPGLFLHFNCRQRFHLTNVETRFIDTLWTFNVLLKRKWILMKCLNFTCNSIHFEDGSFFRGKTFLVPLQFSLLVLSTYIIVYSTIILGVILYTYTSMYIYLCAMWMPFHMEASIGSPGTGVIDSWELPCGCWESSPVWLSLGQGWKFACTIPHLPNGFIHLFLFPFYFAEFAERKNK